MELVKRKALVVVVEGHLKPRAALRQFREPKCRMLFEYLMLLAEFSMTHDNYVSLDLLNCLCLSSCSAIEDFNNRGSPSHSFSLAIRRQPSCPTTRWADI